MGDVLWMARELRRRGVGVVLCEYRGYGLSAASVASGPSEAGLYQDAEAILGALAAQGIRSDQIALFAVESRRGVEQEKLGRTKNSYKANEQPCSPTHARESPHAAWTQTQCLWRHAACNGLHRPFIGVRIS